MPGDLTTEVDGRLVPLSNLDKPLFPDGFTKAEVIDYHLRIAGVMLPHLRDRCITRLRFPNGADQGSFYEKNLPNGAPAWVHTQRVLASSDVIDYPVATSAADLVWLANLAALELHTPQWRVADTAHHSPGDPVNLVDARADTVVVDLDPGPGITRRQSAEAAMIVATELAGDGLIPFVKTSGSKGLQISAAIEPTPSTRCVEFVQALAKRLAAEHPDRFVATMAKNLRVDRIYVDYLQNQAARNTINVYSLRAREHPFVATPVTWDEVAAVRSDTDLIFTASDVLERVGRHGDLWAELLNPDAAGQLPASD